MASMIRKRDPGDSTASIVKLRYTTDEEGQISEIVGPRAEIADQNINQKAFRIRLADNDEGRNSASMLINKMYAWRGYATSSRIQEHPNRITLTASDEGIVFGTVTLSIDSEIGILADEIFKDQIDLYRNQGAKVSELIKLAFDPALSSKQILASLFHVAFIYGRHLHRCTDVFIEVNPRHRRFYERMLGFKQLGEMKMNPRVNAPAYLLWANLDYVEQQIKIFGGTSSNPGSGRSLYPYFFSYREEIGIANRLFSVG